MLLVNKELRQRQETKRTKGKAQMVVAHVAGQLVASIYMPPDERSKLEGAEMIAEFFAETGYAEDRWVIAGDFNDVWHESPSGAVLARAGGRPMPFRKATRWAGGREIDWIVVNNDDPEDVMTFHDDIRLSDHIAIEGRLRIHKRDRKIRES